MRAIIAALLCFCACEGASAQAIPLRYGQAYSALRSIFALPLLVAEREGYFVREGLDFSMLPVPGGGERLIAALHDGTADISHVATPFLIHAALAGSDAVAIAAEFNNPVYSLVAKPENRTYADLKGKLIGVAAENGSETDRRRGGKRFDHDRDTQAPGPQRTAERRFSHQVRRWNARSSRLFDGRRL